MEENNKKKLSRKTIWTVVVILLLLIATTAYGYVSHIKKNAPTESEDVIALIPENSANVSEESETGDDSQTVTAPKTGDEETSGEDETVQIQTPKSTLKNGATTYTLQTEKRQVGLKEAEMIVEDEQQVWKSETKVDIFDKAYRGTGNQFTVQNNSDDWNLIAPGTENSYTFWVKNTGAVGVSYEVSFEEYSRPYDLPLEVRVRCGYQYIVGNAQTWEPISVLNETKHGGRLHVKNYAQYTLEWRWPFEGDDAEDTFLGDEAVKQVLAQEITIHTYGEGYDRPIYEEFNILSPKTGDSANVLLWIILMIIAIIAGYVVHRKNKKRKEQ